MTTPAKPIRLKTKRPADKPAPYSALGKDRLIELRADYVAKLAKPSINPTVRMAIQQELAMIKSALKQINIAQSKQDLQAAIQRRAADSAEHMEKMQRALATSSPSAVRITPATPTSTDAANYDPPRTGRYPRGIETLGGFILMRAEQLRAAIRKIRKGQAAHTTVFVDQLDAFIREQDAMVETERAERGKISASMRAKAGAYPPPAETTKRSTPTEWEETWTGDSPDR